MASAASRSQPPINYWQPSYAVRMDTPWIRNIYIDSSWHIRIQKRSRTTQLKTCESAQCRVVASFFPERQDRKWRHCSSDFQRSKYNDWTIATIAVLATLLCYWSWFGPVCFSVSGNSTCAYVRSDRGIHNGYTPRNRHLTDMGTICLRSMRNTMILYSMFCAQCAAAMAARIDLMGRLVHYIYAQSVAEIGQGWGRLNIRRIHPETSRPTSDLWSLWPHHYPRCLSHLSPVGFSKSLTIN